MKANNITCPNCGKDTCQTKEDKIHKIVALYCPICGFSAEEKV